MRSRFLDEIEIKALRAELTPAEWLPLGVALQTGLRVGDVVKIRTRDLAEDGVRYTAQKTGKRGFARLDAETVSQLRKQARYGWCFPSPQAKGKHLTRQAVWYRIKRAAKRACIGAEGVSPHALRKSFAVLLMESSGLDAVQKALQHDRRDVTEMYALSDWLSGENADAPLLRRDLIAIATKIADLLRGH